MAEIGRELGISPSRITRWQRELSSNGSKASLGQGVARDEELTFIAFTFFQAAQKSPRWGIH